MSLFHLFYFSFIFHFCYLFEFLLPFRSTLLPVPNYAGLTNAGFLRFGFCFGFSLVSASSLCKCEVTASREQIIKGSSGTVR